MRGVSYGHVLEHNVAGQRRPPSRRADGTRRFLFNMKELDDSLDRDKVHLKLPVLFAEEVGSVDD